MSAEALLDVLTAHRIGLERLSTGVLKDLLDHLVVVEDDIEAQIRKRLKNAGPGEIDPTSERLTGLLGRIRKAQTEAAKAVTGDLQKALLATAAHESGFTADAYGRALKVNASLEQLGAEQLEAIITSKPMQGRWLKDWFSSFERGTVDRIEQQILIGMTEGEGVDQIVRRLRGTKAEGYRDGVYQTNRRSAETVTRTAMNHVSNQAHVLTLEKNAHLFPKYQWISVLDRKTSPICRHRAGKTFETGKGPIPPAHPNCRSTVIAIPKGMPDDMFGDVSYENWLKKQPAEDVEDILGPTRARLWYQGKLPLDGFANRDGEQIRLDRLREIEQKAWERAGLGEPYKPLPALKGASIGAKARNVGALEYAQKPKFSKDLTAAGMKPADIKTLVKAAAAGDDPDKVIYEGVSKFVNGLDLDESIAAAGFRSIEEARDNFSGSGLDWIADRAREQIAEAKISPNLRARMLDRIDEAFAKTPMPSQLSSEYARHRVREGLVQGRQQANEALRQFVAQPFIDEIRQAARDGRFGDLSSRDWDNLVTGSGKIFSDALYIDEDDLELFLRQRTRETLVRRLTGGLRDPYAGAKSAADGMSREDFIEYLIGEGLDLAKKRAKNPALIDGSSEVRLVMEIKDLPLVSRRVGSADFEAAPGMPMWRGVGDNQNPHDFATRKSTWVGRGVHGNGDYYAGGDANSLGEARSYSKNLVRAKLAPDARILDTSIDPVGVQKALIQGKKIIEEAGNSIIEYAKEETHNKSDEKSRQYYIQASKLVSGLDGDDGAAALALGYDAIFNGDNYWVILNRSKVIIEDADQ